MSEPAPDEFATYNLARTILFGLWRVSEAPSPHPIPIVAKLQALANQEDQVLIW
jgi:hypothetical protein